MIERIFAAMVLLACLVMLLRLFAGPRWRARFDSMAHRAVAHLRSAAHHITHWRSSRRAAERAADDAIRRARASATREGNVYRPESFRRPRKPH